MVNDAKTVTVESSPTEVLKTLTPAQHKQWRITGDLPEAKLAEKTEEKSVETKDSKKTEADSSSAAKVTPEPEKVETHADSVPAKEEPTKPKHNAESRIKELLAENRKLTQQLEDSQKQRVAPAKHEEAPAKPRRTDVDEKTGLQKYATDEAFEEAHEKWLTEKVTADVRKQVAKEAEERTVAEQNRMLQQRMSNSIKITTEKHPDFLEVLKAKEIEKDGKKQTVFEADAVKRIKTGGMIDRWILDSEIGMEILYHLAKNPDEVSRIDSLNAFAAARELTKLEDKLAVTSIPETKQAEGSTDTEKRVSKAPAPAASVGGKATAAIDEEAAAVDAGDFRRFQKTANEADWRKKKAS